MTFRFGTCFTCLKQNVMYDLIYVAFHTDRYDKSDLWSCFATSLKLHFGMGILLWICCIFSEHLFVRISLDGCFCDFFSSDLIALLSCFCGDDKYQQNQVNSTTWNSLSNIFAITIFRMCLFEIFDDVSKICYSRAF